MAMAPLVVALAVAVPADARELQQALPDGTRYPGSVALGMPARQIEVRVTNSDYQKLAR
jgi:hypothetical protein